MSYHNKLYLKVLEPKAVDVAVAYDFIISVELEDSEDTAFLFV